MEGRKIIPTVTTENANTFLKLEPNQIQVQQNSKEHCCILNKVAKIKVPLFSIHDVKGCRYK